MRRLLALFIFLLPAAFLPAADESTFFFKKGDRVVFLGDSITEQYQYSTDVELYLTTRFPDWKLSFLNAGIGGDRAVGGAGRFQRHVLDEKPTAVLINFGMNDAGYGKFNEKANEVYKEKTAEMLEAARKAGVRVALLSPNAVDPRIQKRFELYVETQKQFYAPLKELAEKYGAAYADQYAITRAAQERMAKDDPEAKKVKPYYDGFHTSPPGGMLMAHAILTGLKAPALVSSVHIDAGKASTQRCKVEKLKVDEEVVSFTRSDEATPLPIQKDWLSVLPYMNDLKDLNLYELKIKGLKRGDWEVRIGGKVVGKFTADQLAEGVNLGNVTTGPVFDFGQKVFAAINAKNDINKKRFRGTMLSKKPDPEQIAKLLGQIKEKQEAIHQMLTPQSYEYEVKWVK